MVQIALLLIGMQAVQHHWRSIAMIGVLWSALGLVVLVDPLDGIQDITLHTLGGFLIVEGAVAVLAGITTGAAFWRWAIRGGVLIVIGLMVVQTPLRNLFLTSILFGTALLIDGIVRMASTILVRFSGWRIAVVGSALELVLALLAFSPRPISYEATVPFCVGIALLMSGWTVLRSALLLRRLPPDAPVTSLPIFEQRRGWHVPSMLPQPRHRPGLAADPEQGPVMVVHVWTALASSPDPVRRPLLDRYVAAVDRQGTVSTGHAALEMTPDLYISHYPAIEQDRTDQQFRGALHAGEHNDVPGRFLPGYRYEVDTWCEATEHVAFRTFDAERLRQFWNQYRADATYNLTNRNCSVVVALALDVALEGVLGHEVAWWPPLLRLLSHPDLYFANLLRKRAATMTWTPGLVLDYARALQRVIDPPVMSWPDLAWQALGAYRQNRLAHLSLPSSGARTP